MRQILVKIRDIQGFTRLESVLAGLLAVSILVGVRAVMPRSEEYEPEPEVISDEEEENGGLLGHGGLLLDISRGHSEEEDPSDRIPSLKGKTNMPAPNKAAGAAAKSTKPTAGPAKKPSVKKTAPSQKGQKPAVVPGNKAVAKKSSSKKKGAPAKRPSQGRKFPGVKETLIDIPPGVMEILEGLEDADWSRAVEKQLIGAMHRWAQQDTAAAADFALCIERRGTRNAALSNMLHSWLRDSPEQAHAWFVKSAEIDPFLLNDLTRQFYSKLAVKAPVAAIDGLWDLPTLGMRKGALQSVTQRLMYLQRENEVLELYGIAEADADKKAVIDVIMGSMARYETSVLGEWVFTVPEAEHQDRALNAFVSAWSRDHPRAAAEWVVAEVPEGESRARQISTVVGAWVNEDPIQAAEWLLGLFPASQETDPAVGRFARAVLPQDPAYAAAWSFSVTDQKERWRLMEQIASSWKRKAPDAAREYVSQTDLPQSTKDKLLR